MGEITEMMEEGILCAKCGVYLNIDEEYGNDSDFNGTGELTTCSKCLAKHPKAKAKARKRRASK